ncbi:MAG: PilZ domain-containing protein [Geobacteraceae bacterium]|nr:PilZ domain-containing protein [Geobacteraceae bacterium]
MKKILLVNASRYFFDEGKNLLDRKDFQVFLAPTALKAMQIHRQEKVNLIVADLDMPEMGGDALCHRIREESESRAVSFILVCRDNSLELHRAEKSGANICLKKPFSAKTLLDHVEKMLAVSIRRGYRVLLRAKVKGSKEDTTFFCTSQNLSASGMLIEADRMLLPGDQLSCSFYLPGSAHITADGEVARKEDMPDGKHHYGIRFTEIAANHKHEIETFIAESLARP